MRNKTAVRWAWCVVGSVLTGCAEPPPEACATGTVENADPFEFGPKAPEPSPLPGAPFGGLCDGSDHIRLAFTQAPEPESAASFANPYGWILALDGYCHYFVVTGYMTDVREGWLSRDELGELTRDLAVAELDNYPSTRVDDVFDCATELIATEQSSLSCLCGICGSEAPAAASEAFEKGEAWVRRLAAQGKPLSGPVRAHVFPGRPLIPEPPAQAQTVSVWPLKRDIVDSGHLGGTYWGADDGAVFYGAEADALRALRVGAANEGYSHVFVREGCDMVTFGLYVRDELPSAFRASLHKFVRSAWSREPPVCDGCLPP